MYACETWTRTAADKKRIMAFNMTAYIRPTCVSWREHRSNETIIQELRPPSRHLAEVQRQKLQCFGHLVREDNLSTSILHQWQLQLQQSLDVH